MNELDKTNSHAGELTSQKDMNAPNKPRDLINQNTKTLGHHEDTHDHENDDSRLAHDHNHNQIHGHDHTHMHANTKSVLNRLSRAIGHLTSVRGMVERGQDCSEILIQLSAVRSAINGISRVILKDHLDHCIVDAVKTGDTKTLDELNHAIELLMK